MMNLDVVRDQLLKFFINEMPEGRATQGMVWNGVTSVVHLSW